MSEHATVLYAEDDANDAFFMQRAFHKLQRAGALKLVRDGREAIDYLQGAGEFADRGKFPLPKLLLLDVKMPRVSGLEVLKWVRQQTSLAHLPVVMFTSSTQESDIAFCREHGANGYLAKPSNAQQLSAAVRELTDAANTPTVVEQLTHLSGNQLKEGGSDYALRRG